MPQDPVKHMLPVLAAALQAQEEERNASIILAGFGKLLPDNPQQVDKLLPIFGNIVDKLFEIVLHENAQAGFITTAPDCEIANDINEDEGGFVEHAVCKANSYLTTVVLGGLVDYFPNLFETRHIDRFIDICEAIEAERLVRGRPDGDPYEALIDLAEFNAVSFNTKQINRLWAKRDNAPSADFVEERPYSFILSTLAKTNVLTDATLRVRRLMPHRPVTSGTVLPFRPVSR